MERPDLLAAYGSGFCIRLPQITMLRRGWEFASGIAVVPDKGSGNRNQPRLVVDVVCNYPVKNRKLMRASLCCQ